MLPEAMYIFATHRSILPHMRIATRLSIALAASGLVIFAVHGAVQLEKERQDLLQFSEQQMRAVGAAAQYAAAAEWRDQGPNRAARVFEAMSQFDLRLQGTLTDGEGRPVKPSAISLHPLDKRVVDRALATGAPAVDFDDRGNPHRAAFAAVLPGSGNDGTAAFVLGRPVPEVRRDLAEMRRGIALSVGLFVLAVALIGLVLGHLYVTRPVRTLVQAIERVRAGELQSALVDVPGGELGQLAEHFNAMVLALERARTNLAHEIESRSTLERGLTRIDKLVTLGQLSASLAHEIGSPLQVLTGRARMLPSRAADPEEVRRIANLIVTQTERIARIVEQLLTVARRPSPRLAPVFPAACASLVLELLEPRARAVGVSLRLEATDDATTLCADVDQLQQIFLNLVGNAIDATTAGGTVEVLIRPSAMAPLGGGAPMPSVLILVEDSGIGMSQQTLEHLFEPFYTTRAAEGGTGLGLAVVKAIVTEHAGTVRAESRGDRGSRFLVELPVNEPPVAMKEDDEHQRASA